MKLISSILICLVSLLASVGASAQGGDWRAVLEGEKAKNAQRMAAIEEERACPDVDRLVVLRGEIVIEADEEELFNLRSAIGIRRGFERSQVVGA